MTKITKTKTTAGELGDPITTDLEAIVELMRSDDTKDAAKRVGAVALQSRLAEAQGVPRYYIEDADDLPYRNAGDKQQFIVALIEVLQCIAYNLPVYKILGVQDWQSRRTVETGGRHIVIFTTWSHADVRVRVVGIDYRIGVCSIAIVRRPYFRFVLS